MKRDGRVEVLLSPSLFAVYMYHTGAGFNVLRSMETYFVSEVGMPVYVNHVVTDLLVFWGCVVIDFPRRLLCRVARPLIERWCGWVDEQYGKLVG